MTIKDLRFRSLREADEEVEAELKKEQEKNSRTITVEDRAAQNGDTATIDFEGFVDGEAFEGGKGTDYRAYNWFQHLHPGIRGAACWS